MAVDRIKQWDSFDEQVRRHITQYTIVQYGNPDGDEQVDAFTPEDCWREMQRYYNRRNSSVRGHKESLRDLLKVAHYAQIIHQKLQEQFGLPDVYPEGGENECSMQAEYLLDEEDV